MRTSRRLLLAGTVALACLPVGATALTALTHGGPAAPDGVVVVLGDLKNDDRKIQVAGSLASPRRWLLVARDQPCPHRLPGLEAYRQVVCFKPEPLTTRGEARFAARFASSHEASAITIVTSQDQLARAALRFRRCWSGDLRVVEVHHARREVLSRYPYQVAAMLRAWLLQPRC